MRIRFLGSAAYDAIPAPFCSCDTCTRSRKAGGRNIRSRSQVLLDEDLLIDFNADTIMHFFQYNIDSQRIKYCLITHSHSDHLYVPDILIPQYSQKATKVEYYSALSGYLMIKKGIEESPNMERFTAVTCIEPYQEFRCGDYRILALPANHDPDTTPVFYAIEKGEKRILYAHDTGAFFEEILAKLQKFGRFDLVSLDCTGAIQKGYRDGHMCIDTNLEIVARLKEIKVVDEKTKLVLNHFSHNGGATYDELLLAAPKEFIISYDGLSIEL